MSASHHFKGIGSVAIHTAQSDLPEHAHLSPIFASSTFTFDNAEQGQSRFAGSEKGYIYSRYGNPTSTVAEKVIAALEGFKVKQPDGQPLALKALLHASGQAASATMLFSVLSAGDSVLSHPSLYGGTHEFLYTILPQYGINSMIQDLRDMNKLEDTIKKTPSLKLIHIETPSNPTMRCIDLEAVCGLARQYGILTSADNTFASPYLQQPFKYGVDFVFHSTTKFLNGHGSAIGGVFIGKDESFMNGKAYKYYKMLGGNSNPFDAFLLTQGMKTLELRMERHCDNAEAVAHYLNGHSSVAKVNYNGLTDHPDYSLTCKQMRRAGSVLSFELKDGLIAGKNFINKLNMCVRAVSVGTADTLVSHPASMSHSAVPHEDRLSFGITDGLVRMSVGLENIEDILSDLDQALGK
ncbi:MAG: aminotransferase class I/II-fold pyridoxal phosphate-dependent enzyme [Flavitalea sp.]